MDWHYTADPVNVPADAVRLLCGDTQAAQPLLQDAEVEWCLNQNTNIYYAAAEAAQLIASSYARRVDRTVGKLSIKGTDLVKQYQDLVESLKRQAVLTSGVTPYAGGISLSDKQAENQDTDRTPPSFTRKMQDYPGAVLPVEMDNPEEFFDEFDEVIP